MSRAFEKQVHALVASLPALEEELAAADPDEEGYETLKNRFHRSINTLAKAVPVCNGLCDMLGVDLDQETPPNTQPQGDDIREYYLSLLPLAMLINSANRRAQASSSR